jgi:hypothetical protein
MIRNKIIAFLTFGLAGMTPSYAFAHGDFVLLYSLTSIAIMHLGIAIYILFSKRFKKYRFAILGIYLAVAVISWNWAMSYRGPDFPQMYTVLVGGPILALLCIIWLYTKIRVGENSKPKL